LSNAPSFVGSGALGIAAEILAAHKWGRYEFIIEAEWSTDEEKRDYVV
jgi:hypothetical protein